MPDSLLAFTIPFLVALVLTAVLRRCAPALGLMDAPDPRKVHVTPTPRAGGLAIFAGLLAGWAWMPESVGWLAAWYFLLMASVIVVLGFADDLRPLPWWSRLGVQAVIAVLIVWDMPNLDLPGSHVLAGLWLVAMVNAFNMLDNMDALSAGTAWIATLAFLTLAVLRLGTLPARVELLALGAIAGFLVHNWPPARIFMGDAGSTLLGLIVGMLGLEVISAGQGEVVSVVAVLVICAVPLYDQASVVLLRLSQGRSPFHPDRQHLSHRITDRGWSRPGAVFWIHGLALATGVVGVLLYTRPLEVALTLALLVLVGWLSLAGYEFGPWRRRG